MAVITIHIIKAYIALVRPKNWLKNIFVFIPLVFSLELFNADKLSATVIAFVVFCIISSVVYVLNDICDARKDAAHPEKCSRPIAAGTISKQKALLFAIFLAIIGFIASFTINLLVSLLIAIYLTLNLWYSIRLKHEPILDCFCIAMGFVLRVCAGGAASGEMISDWLFLTIVAMSLFMAFGKRRGELINIGSNSKTREVLQRYDLNFLQGMFFVCAGLAIVFYSLWTMNRGDNMIYTVPLIIFIVSKYLLIVHSSDSYGDPTTVILEDKTLLVASILYGLLTIILLYFRGSIT